MNPQNVVTRKILLLIVVALITAGCNLSAHSPASEPADFFARVKISQGSMKTSIPLGQRLTIVNLFEEFCTECPTGSRFETMERLYLSRQTTTKIFVVFSETRFSTQDVENFKEILSMPDSLVQGDIESMTPYLIKGKLLIVFDANKRVVWQEKPEMSEQQVFSAISGLMQIHGNESQ